MIRWITARDRNLESLKQTLEQFVSETKEDVTLCGIGNWLRGYIHRTCSKSDATWWHCLQPVFLHGIPFHSLTVQRRRSPRFNPLTVRCSMIMTFTGELNRSSLRLEVLLLYRSKRVGVAAEFAGSRKTRFYYCKPQLTEPVFWTQVQTRRRKSIVSNQTES